MSRGSVLVLKERQRKIFLVANATVQMHVARLELRLLDYRNALIAAVLNEDVVPVTT